MGLWEPGKVNFVTPAIILAVCTQAAEDHAGGVEFTGPLRKPEEMHVTELVELDASSGDGAFDRVSYAMHNGETFHSPNGEKWRVKDYHGKPWTLERVETVAEAMAYPNREITIRTITEETIAEWLIASNGPHPNPYVARIEVAYASLARAGYGIRQDGTFDLWYD